MGKITRRVATDVGGTFTDLVCFETDTETGASRVITAKTDTTPPDFETGVLNVLEKGGVDPSEVDFLAHGTTAVINALTERKGAKVGLITTEGFRDTLEIARGNRPDFFNLHYEKPAPFVPRYLRAELPGRITYMGEERTPLDLSGLGAILDGFRAEGVEAVAICFLHSYANDAHELAMREILRREHPGAIVSISSEVLREYREYERSMTTLVDAAVKPNVSRYVSNIHERLDAYVGDTDREIPFYVMKSNGGVLSADEVVHQPITTVLSGPAAGALGAALIAQVAGFPKVLTCDGGGTSTDVSVVLDGEPTLTTEGTVGAYPSKIPMIDVVTVGAGGGSIAWISPEGALKVGPQSAGADPGPLCYAKGGTEPTITDAHVVLGRIPPHLLGGEIPLDVAAARRGITELAATLGLEFERCATGILEISAWNQANALRQVSVKRGLDVRDFMLTTFGGSGSLLACRLVDILDLAGVVVPPNPGNVSAFGLLTVDVKNDYVQTHVSRQDSLDHGAIQGILDALTDKARAALTKEGFAADEHRFVRTVDVRYVGQAFEVRVPAPEGVVDDAYAAAVADTFHGEHRQLYGYDFRGDPTQQVEWVNLRVTGIGPITRPELHPIAAAEGELADRAVTDHRDVCFEAEHGYVRTPVIDRARLGAGDAFSGPAIVEEFGSTIPVHPGFDVRVDDYGNLVIRKEGSR